jgi:guanine deaminase
VNQPWQPALLRRCVQLAASQAASGTGGPFAALISRDGEILAEAANTVTPDADPTAHAEVNAIRLACRKLGSFQLTGCELYSSCEPCPMCLGAIYWARLDRVFFAATRNDAAQAGFDDQFIYQQIPLDPAARSIPMLRLDGVNGAEAFEAWLQNPKRIPY